MGFGLKVVSEGKETTTMADMTVANTILEQLGKQKFIVMTGARNFLGAQDSLSFRLPSNFAKKGINYIKITLSPADTYDIVMGKIRGLKFTSISETEGVYAEDLRRIISEETGLALSL